MLKLQEKIWESSFKGPYSLGTSCYYLTTGMKISKARKKAGMPSLPVNPDTKVIMVFLIMVFYI